MPHVKVGLEAGLTARVIDRLRQSKRHQGNPVSAVACELSRMPLAQAPIARIHNETGALVLSDGVQLPAESPRSVYQQLRLLWTPACHAYQPREARRVLWLLLLVANRAHHRNCGFFSHTPFELWEDIFSGCIAVFHAPRLDLEAP